MVDASKYITSYVHIKLVGPTNSPLMISNRRQIATPQRAFLKYFG